MAKWKPPRRKRIGKPARVPTGIGNGVEQKHFLGANPALIKAIENVYATAKLAFLRTLRSNEPADRVGFYLGRMCVEEFSEILLLAGNGHGVGALKILRGMYERAVTSAYILAQPDEADAFLEYDKVNKHKAYMHAKKLEQYGPKLTPEAVKQIEGDYEAVKPLFLNGSRVRGSWTKLDTASLAKEAGAGYEQLYLDAFYLPTLQIHTTASSVLGRLEMTQGGKMSFASGPTRKEAGHAMIMAHNLILRVLDSQNRHFKLGLDDALQNNLADFQDAYRSDRPGAD